MGSVTWSPAGTAQRWVPVSVSLIAVTTACSLLAPSDSEFKSPGAAGADAAGAGTAGASGSTGGAGATSGSGANGEGGSNSGASGGSGTEAFGGVSGTVADASGSSGAGASDADSGPDSGCGLQNTVGSCGPRCEKCAEADDRTLPTCDGTSCGVTCRNPALKCSDDSCSQLSWNFDSGSLAGVASSFPLAVRTFEGSKALAVDVAQLNVVPQITFSLPICGSGTLDLRAKTLSFRVYFQGLPESSGELVLAAWLPSRPTNGAFLGQIGPSTGTWSTFSAAMSESIFSGSTTTVMIEIATTGVGFSGTVWFEDFLIQ
jgi:hypothetical protein